MSFLMADERRFFNSPGASSLIDACDEACQSGAHVAGALFSASTDVGDLMELLAGPRARARGLKLQGDSSPYLLTVPRIRVEDSSVVSRPAKALVHTDQQDRLICLLSCQPTRSLVDVATTLHRFLRPMTCKVFLRTAEFHDAFNSIARSEDAISIRVKEYTSRSLIDDPDSAKRVRTDREWTDEDYSVVFAKLHTTRHWLTSLKIEVRGTSKTVGRVWRDASFVCEAGFPFFLETVVATFRRAVQKSRTFFEKRDTSTSPTGKCRPVKIAYQTHVFEDKKQNHRLVSVLQSLRDSALSVYHPNPYLHASLLDYADGSSYDIWITTLSSILVVPKQKATTASLERLCDHICDQFEEGDVVEFQA